MLDKVRQAKQKLKEEIYNLPQVKGIGISCNENGDYCIKVFINKEGDEKSIPKTIDGVDVETEVIGEFKFL